MSETPVDRVNTRRHVLGQIVVCKGCCCGRPDKGQPALPEERLRQVWKKEKLMKTIQLTVSGCLGPCDVSNVVQVITSEGTVWYGSLNDEAQYEALITWARACHAARSLLPRPKELEPLRFVGYIQPSFDSRAV
jgi:predicted metal-binding protein